MSTQPDIYQQRRYDIDWLRILALSLLIIYHVVISFQPWAHKIYFIQNQQPLEWLWIFMAIINIWRIPILFMISGMGARFAMEHRNWKNFLKDRVVRILLPLTFGFFLVYPLSTYIFMKYHEKEFSYTPNSGHLWFLFNIFLYILFLLPLLVYWKNQPNNLIFRFLSKQLHRPNGFYLLFVFALPMIVEAWILDPKFFVLYVQTPHGFWLGMICFISGFIFISIQNVFWQAVKKIRHHALIVASLLYLVRLIIFRLEGDPNILNALESFSWMLAIFGYGALYLNRSSHRLHYFSKAVYPIYIIHLPVQYSISYYLIPQSLPAILKLLILLVGTFGMSWLIYHQMIRRLKWIRPLFGMKLRYH